MAVVFVTPGAVTPDLRSAIGDDTWRVEELLAELATTERTMPPFDERATAFCQALSTRLLAERTHPEAVSLGYWLRRSSIERARDAHRALGSERVLLVPRGLVFHVTPANVDSVFVYSWVLSLLCGNANVVRLSSRSTPLRERLLAAVQGVLDDPAHEALRARNRIVLGTRDEHVSVALSSVADVRVVWGGDATVETFRRYPLPPRGRDVTFPNRHSLAVLDAASVARASTDELRGLADRFFNDAYWFDQGACSSPRLIVWRVPAPASVVAREARARFHVAVSEAIARRGYVVPTAIAIAKMTLALECAALSGDVSIERVSNEATWVLLPGPGAYDRHNVGGGLFFEIESADLPADLDALVTSVDQTAACYGIDQAEVADLARALNGRGIDRWVGIGHALEFGSTWDGYDLLSELSKRVVVDV